MTLEQLLALGLTEEVAGQVVALYTEATKDTVPRARLNEVIEQKKKLETDVADRDAQLEGLKGVNAEELQAKITELQTANTTAKTEYEAKLHEQAFSFAMKEALTGAKARNHKALESLLNKDTIKLEDGSLTGLEEQLKALKESDAYLFEADVDPATPPATPPKFSVGNHSTNNDSGDAFTKALFGKE